MTVSLRFTKENPLTDSHWRQIDKCWRWTSVHFYRRTEWGWKALHYLKARAEIRYLYMDRQSQSFKSDLLPELPPPHAINKNVDYMVVLWVQYTICSGL